MENAKISSYQLFSLIYIFILGTTMIFPVGANGEKAAWISIIIGMVGGIPLLAMYHYLNIQYPNLLLTDYCRKILGKLIGTIIGVLYVLYFLYGAARDVRDAMELMPLFLNETPTWAIGAMILLPITFGLFLGIEVIARTSEIFFPYIVLTVVLMVIFVIFSDIVNVENLFPVLEPGWGKIIQGALTDAWMAPFGEMICFTMIFAYLQPSKSPLKVGLVGVLTGGFVIVFTHLLIISVLGGDIRNESIAPLLVMVKKINVGDFIQRLDALFMIGLILNDFFKIVVFMYAAVIGAAAIFKISKNRLIIPFSLIVMFTSMFFADSYTTHMAQSDIVLKYVYPIFAAYIPLLLCTVSAIRQKFKKNKAKYGT
ncbi:spore gernimation protein GerB [Bacillus timonensis]|uniref:Spore gernimation protein GerB n=1 Tax=Bacillus timonensis TaxID=1033734 RepID=A0A4S3PTM5_9BACI|nr:endospore germination permease [Bacillus timonensis]THE13127.1 spore gernimation protein GerB [Bacillus timonensis]